MPSEKTDAKLDLILSRLDAIERHLSINPLQTVTRDSSLHRKVWCVSILLVWVILSIQGHYFSVNLFSFLLIRILLWICFFSLSMKVLVNVMQVRPLQLELPLHHPW